MIYAQRYLSTFNIKKQNKTHNTNSIQTRSVAAGFGWHYMPPPAANDKMAQTDHVTLRSWSLTLEVTAFVADAGHRPPSKFVSLAIQKICHTMCVSINGPGDPDLWPFDLETGVRVASKVDLEATQETISRSLRSNARSLSRLVRLSSPYIQARLWNSGLNSNVVYSTQQPSKWRIFSCAVVSRLLLVLPIPIPMRGGACSAP